MLSLGLLGSDGLRLYPTLTEFTIAMPHLIRAGLTTFDATNTGTLEHNLAIEGAAMSTRFDANLKPGDNRALHVTLPPGRYRVYCPVSDHQARGMAVDLEVRAR